VSVVAPTSGATRPWPLAEQIAHEVLAAAHARKEIVPFSQRIPGLDLTAAYAVTAALRGLREARGERHVGRKIGFTNRVLWAEYQVLAPIWGDMYDTTVHALADTACKFELAALLHARIEPEIAFGFAKAPEPGMDEAALLGCVEWFAHGFEIVQSPFPDWRFAAADVVAAAGLHGAFLMGSRHRVEDTATALLRALTTFEVTLRRNDEVVDSGRGANVLDGPLTALRHLVALLADDPANPPLTAGEIVTTGSLTRALPVAAGERWSTEIRGLPIDGLAVAFA
jgi:2-oxo-3-hexenedioate decarboxylase